MAHPAARSLGPIPERQASVSCDHGDSERENRRRRIDPQLEQQGWQVVGHDPSRPVAQLTRHAVTEYPTANGPADYAPLRRRPPAGDRRGQAALAGAAERPGAGGTLLPGRGRQSFRLRRLPRAPSLRDQR